MITTDGYKNLKKAVNFDPSKERKDLPISRLNAMIENGEIVLPVFQTYIRWTTQKMILLFNYQLLAQSPVAPISINLIDDPEQVIEQISFLTRKLIDKDQLIGKMSVVDGQQRLSTSYKAYTDNPELKNVVLDLKKGYFIELNPDSTTGEINISSHQIPVGKLYHKEQDVYLEYVNSNPYLKRDEHKDLLNSVRKKNEQYYYVVNFATNLSKEDQMKWFEVLNLAGSQVTADMVYLTDLLVKGVDFYTDYANIFGDKLDSINLGDLFPRKSAEISIPLAALNPAYFKVSGKEQTLNSAPFPSDTKAKGIGSLEVSQIREIIQITLEGLDTFIEYVKKNDLVSEIDRIDLITYVTGLFIEQDITDISSLTNDEKDYIENFIKNADFVNNSNSERRLKYRSLINDFPSLITAI